MAAQARVAEPSRRRLPGTEPDIVGYYALAAGAIMPRDATARLARGMAANLPVPVVLLGRLAVDTRHQSKRLWRSLLQDAMMRVLQADELIGIRALLVHAIDEHAREWYMQFGFERSPTHPLHLILLIKNLRATLSSSSVEGPKPHSPTHASLCDSYRQRASNPCLRTAR